MNPVLASVTSSKDLVERRVLAFPETLTVAEAIQKLREAASRLSQGGKNVGYLYVTDQEGHLAGVMEMRELLLNPGETCLETLMKREVISLRAGMTDEEILEVFRNHPYLVLPVTDAGGKLLGSIPFTRVAPLLEKRTGAVLYQATGMDLPSEARFFDREEISHRSILKMMALRSPWLILSIVSGLAAAFVLGNYFIGIETIISLILFIPIVLGLSGSMARQSAVLVNHEFGRGGVSLSMLGRVLAKESLLAAFTGLLTAVTVGLLALILQKSLLIALAIGLGIAAAVLLSGALGALFPFLFVAVKLDPRIASGPLTVALCDLAALWTYLQVAYEILS